MVNKKLMLIGLLLFIFLLCFQANANEGWYQNANSNYQSQGGSSFVMYGSNTANPNSNITYQKCSFLHGSDYQPVSADFTRDGFIDIVLTDTDSDTIYFYGADCQLENSYSLVNEYITAMPVINKRFGGSIYSLNILTNASIKDYGYFNSELGFINFNIGSKDGVECSGVQYSDYAFWNTGKVLDYIACNNDECLLFGKGDYFVYHLDLISQYNKFTNTSEKLSVGYSFYNSGGSYEDMNSNGINSILGLNNNDWVIACSIGDNPSMANAYKRIYCSLVDITTGEVKKTFLTPAYTTLAYKPSRIYEMNYGGAVQGSEKRIYLTYYIYGKGGSMYSDLEGVSVFDLVGNRLYTDDKVTISGSSDLPLNVHYDYSNIAVADFNKDGSNEMCYFKCETTLNNKIFSCFDSDYNLVFNKANMSSDFAYTGSEENTCPNFVLGDLMPEYDNMCLATVEGIFCFNGTNDTIQVYDTGYTTGAGTPIIVESDNNRTLSIVYADANKGFIISPNFINYSSCGDGICDIWENEFTCPEDFAVCLLREGEEPPVEGEMPEGWKCTTDADCEYGLTCEYGVCSPSGHGEECDDDDDCISGDCEGGYCTKPSTWDLMDATKNQQFGDDTNTNNFIALGIMIALAGMLGFYAGIWVGIASFFMTAIFFVMVGWLSGFILIGLLIVGVIALFFSFMAQTSGGQ